MPRFVICLCLVLAAACAAPPEPSPGRVAESAAGMLTEQERAVAEWVDAHNDEALALIERSVNLNSGTMNFDGVRRLGEVYRAEFETLGFTTTWVDGSGWNRAGHLVASHPGSGGGPKILLIGHIDTVFEPDSPFQSATRVDADHTKGPGITDMKGGNVILLYALKALDAAGLLDAMHVVVVLTGDEEAPGRPLSLAREALVTASEGARYAIGFENGDGDPSHAVTARRGTTTWRLEVTGATGHSSQVFSEALGAGAIYEAARILQVFRERLAGEEFLTFNPGAIVGGTAAEFDGVEARGTAAGKTNVVAARAIVSGDLRAVSVEQFERAKAAMWEIVQMSLPKTQAEISFDEGYPPLAPSAGNDRLLALYNQASLDLGLGPVTAVSPMRAGAADVSFVAAEVPMIIDAVGLKGRDDHSPDETADLRTLPVQIKRAAVLLARIGQ
jgi:glutamate carboxypeptidase